MIQNPLGSVIIKTVIDKTLVWDILYESLWTIICYFDEMGAKRMLVCVIVPVSGEKEWCKKITTSF